VVAEPAGDQRAREGADVDRHVVERETGVPALVVGAVELADHGGHVGLEQAGAGADEAQAGPGHRARGDRHRVVPAGDQDPAPQHRAVRAEDAVGEPAARDRDEIDQGSVGCGYGCGRSGRHAHAAVRDGIREVEDEDGLHAQERETLPDLETGEREQPLGLAEEGVVVPGGRLVGGLGFKCGTRHDPLLPPKSINIRSYQVIKNIPVMIRYRLGWTGWAAWVIESRPDTLT
jgi:hypothetical protein